MGVQWKLVGGVNGITSGRWKFNKCNVRVKGNGLEGDDTKVVWADWVMFQNLPTVRLYLPKELCGKNSIRVAINSSLSLVQMVRL